MDEKYCDLNADCDDDQACILNENRCSDLRQNLIEFDINKKRYYAESFDAIHEAIQQLATLKKSEMKELKCTLGQDYMETFEEFAGKSVDDVKKILAGFDDPDDLITIINATNGTVYCEGLNYFKQITESKLEDKNFQGYIFNINDSKHDIDVKRDDTLAHKTPSVLFSNFTLLSGYHFICDNELVKNLRPMVYYLVNITNMRWRDINFGMGAHHTAKAGDTFYILVPVAEHRFFCNRFKGGCEKMTWNGEGEKPSRWKGGISLKKCKQNDCSKDIMLRNKLLEHIGNDNIKGVKKVYQEGFPVETTHYIDLACANNSIDMVKLLLKYGCPVDYYNSHGLKPLHETLSPEIAKLLLKEKGVNIDDETQRGGETVLHIAIRERNMDMIKFLLDNGANVHNRTNTTLKNALDMVIEYREDDKVVGFNRLDVIKLLVDKGADIFDKNDSGSTILFSITNDDSIDLVKFLIKKGVNINHINYRGDTCLHAVVERGLKNITKYLIKHGANFKHRNEQGETPLFTAVRWGNSGIVKLLIKAGADVNSRNIRGVTALFYLMHDNVEIVEYFVENKINMNTVDHNGDTFLHYAARSGFSQIFKYLLKKGSDINVKNVEGFTPLFYLAANNFKDLIESIDKKKIDFNCKNYRGETILFSIFKNGFGNIDIVNLLIKKGFDINEVDIDGNNLLFHSVTDESQTDNLKYLVEKGLDVNHINYRGSTPLHHACKHGIVFSLKYLIENGAKIDAKDLYGNTPLLIATENIRPEIIDILLLSDADFTIKNNENRKFIDFIKYGILAIESSIKHQDDPFSSLSHLSEENKQKGLDRYKQIIKCFEDVENGL